MAAFAGISRSPGCAPGAGAGFAVAGQFCFPDGAGKNFAAAGRIRFPDGAIARDFCDSGDYSRQHIKEKGFPSKNLHGTL